MTENSRKAYDGKKIEQQVNWLANLGNFSVDFLWSQHGKDMEFALPILPSQPPRHNDALWRG